MEVIFADFIQTYIIFGHWKRFISIISHSGVAFTNYFLVEKLLSKCISFILSMITTRAPMTPGQVYTNNYDRAAQHQQLDLLVVFLAVIIIKGHFLVLDTGAQIKTLFRIIKYQDQVHLLCSGLEQKQIRDNTNLFVSQQMSRMSLHYDLLCFVWKIGIFITVVTVVQPPATSSK